MPRLEALDADGPHAATRKMVKSSAAHGAGANYRNVEVGHFLNPANKSCRKQ